MQRALVLAGLPVIREDVPHRSAGHHRVPARCACRQLLAAVLCAYLVIACAQASAQSYPSRPIRMVVGFGPGGNADLLTRPLAQKMSQALGQQVVIDNRAGASGMIGLELVAKSPPDGYTLLSTPQAPFVIIPHLQSKMPVNVLNDLAPVTPFARFAFVLVTNPTVPAKTVNELIALAKRKPGMLKIASPGVGTGFQLAGELFKSMAGIEILHVPYKEASTRLSDVMSGRVDMMFDTIAVVAPHVKAGKLRALAVTGPTRSVAWPELPTVAEAGVQGYEFTGWFGVFAPAATSRDVIGKVNGTIVKILATQEMKDFYASQDVEATTSTPSEFATRLRAEYERLGRVIKASGLKPE
jgi:tripartite-type tricarboxylate transporter receptor subunit TctC